MRGEKMVKRKKHKKFITLCGVAGFFCLLIYFLLLVYSEQKKYIGLNFLPKIALIFIICTIGGVYVSLVSFLFFLIKDNLSVNPLLKNLLLVFTVACATIILVLVIVGLTTGILLTIGNW